MAFAAVATVHAQDVHTTEEVTYNDDKYRVETNSFWSNWFISVGAGGNVYFGDHDRQADFGKRIAPALDIAVGKWFIPEVGVRLMYSGLSAKGATQTDVHVDGDEMWGDWLKDQKFNFFNIRLDAMFVDEGFGALDAESLDQACDALLGLAGQNCLIGIISHVPQLRERISQQLIIDKTGGGSLIRNGV